MCENTGITSWNWITSPDKRNTVWIQNFILKHAYMYFAVRVKLVMTIIFINCKYMVIQSKAPQNEISDFGAMQDTKWQK